MPKSIGRPMRVHQSSRTGAFEAVIHPDRSLPRRIICFVIRARAELFMAGLLLWVYVGVLQDLESSTAIAVVAIAVVVMTAVGPIRRFLIRRYWCVVSRHRARTCFRSTWTMTYSGRLPLLLWSRPTPVGDRI